ncbi:MAG: DNA-processing protein DprA [Ignavibacteriaceae bacterium]|jgi:predicted Rossmann fold nucleotide-binding protein DprA/Smf involved in DNA uptake|nr:DNA-processing protein DprA [Ignavibacteriaceae bacterium]MCW8817867.1 DNA-processing protein DprA [Ignavibacteriaceae bacterium]MCW8824426.1 DNA-processing protein DprA [Ignavibacteriaceae bacterium]MCW9095336.1 DNA-processing protein DprA [Ignavibacteriaceae bacterium]MCW9098566.1 DNA-processing protein DprA [Ignavibacteriaceae bacterium]
MEILNTEKQSIVLLTSYFKKPGKDDVNPLTPTEWKIFAGWLRDRGYTPGSLLSEDGENIIESWNNGKITRERLISLLKRGAQMSMVLEKWSRAGIWVLTRSDAEYPLKLKKRLGELSPPVLFGSGNKKLINSEGIAVVGSRNISDKDINYSKELGNYIAEKKLTLISGGAKGVDETSMLGALENNGRALGVLADSLFQKSISQTYRKYLSEGKLVFISAYYPEAGFNIGNAMGRNKYIYCLSEVAVVVHSGLKGGTWTGANENLKKKWVPLFVKENHNRDSGNDQLINNGGKVLKYEMDLKNLVDKVRSDKESEPVDYSVSVVYEPKQVLSPKVTEQPSREPVENNFEMIIKKSFYELFIIKLHGLLKDREVKQKELKENMEITSAQLNVWLKRAEKDGIIKKLSKPVRYKLTDYSKTQTDLFS